MGYAKDHAGPCVREQGPCTCQSCEELGASYDRARAIARTSQSAARAASRRRLAS